MTSRAPFPPAARAVLALGLILIASLAAPGVATAAPEGQMTWAVHVSMAPTWFDPAETVGVITPFMFLYALHDALVKPMPGNPAAPSLAESWTASPDSLVYEFVLRKGAKFHNGDPVTADDVKFSFERYKGAAAALYKARVASVEAVDPAPGPVPHEERVAGLHDVLRDAGHRRRLDRAAEVRREGGR